ncbi:hypothetical protein D920_00168, partial [Enterococcus faecalis 13-SD-W-01]
WIGSVKVIRMIRSMVVQETQEKLLMGFKSITQHRQESHYLKRIIVPKLLNVPAG